MTTKAVILQAIRATCVDCSCHQPGEIRKCLLTVCGLWPDRFGRDPEPSATRGFAKPHVYAQDSGRPASGRHSDSDQGRLAAEPHVYTGSSAMGEAVPPSRSSEGPV